MNTAARKWPEKTYGFRAVSGSLVALMKVTEGPGQKHPGNSELFTPTFTPHGLHMRGFGASGHVLGAVLGLLTPVKAGKEVPEHREALG